MRKGKKPPRSLSDVFKMNAWHEGQILYKNRNAATMCCRDQCPLSTDDFGDMGVRLNTERPIAFRTLAL